MLHGGKEKGLQQWPLIQSSPVNSGLFKHLLNICNFNKSASRYLEFSFKTGFFIGFQKNVFF